MGDPVGGVRIRYPCSNKDTLCYNTDTLQYTLLEIGGIPQCSVRVFQMIVY